MRYRTSLFFCWIWLYLALVPASAQPTTSSAQAFAPTIAEARERIASHMAEHNVPGLAIAVSIDGETIWAEGFGYSDVENRSPVWPTTRFRIGSISKPMTSIAVARLVEEGLLDLDAPVQRYVPNFPQKRWPVTTRQLGGHLAGVRHYNEGEFWSNRRYDSVTESLDIFAADSLLFEPGTGYHYSSYGWVLISAVVEQASGSSFLQAMDDLVFTPLGMQHTHADHADSLITQRARPYSLDEAGQLVNAQYVDTSNKWAAGGFLSTVEDLLLMGNKVVLGDFLSEEGRAVLFTEQHKTTGEGVGYGLGWNIGKDGQGRTRISHSGSSVGGTSWLAIQPESGMVLAVTSNLTFANLHMILDVYSMFAEKAEHKSTK